MTTKKMIHGENDENITKHENEQKEDETGENDDDALLDNV